MPRHEETVAIKNRQRRCPHDTLHSLEAPELQPFALTRDAVLYEPGHDELVPLITGGQCKSDEASGRDLGKPVHVRNRYGHAVVVRKKSAHRNGNIKQRRRERVDQILAEGGSKDVSFGIVPDGDKRPARVDLVIFHEQTLPFRYATRLARPGDEISNAQENVQGRTDGQQPEVRA